jgi:DHA2 family multidrug resistance protein-like MFS transporter
MVIFAAGLIALALMPRHANVTDIVWRMALAGAGFGLFQSPNNRAMITSAPRERSGGASGMLGTGRLLGQTAGAALVALIFARSSEHGETVSLYVAAGFALLAAGVSSIRLLERDGLSASRPLRDAENAVGD